MQVARCVAGCTLHVRVAPPRDTCCTLLQSAKRTPAAVAVVGEARSGKRLLQSATEDGVVQAPTGSEVVQAPAGAGVVQASAGA